MGGNRSGKSSRPSMGNGWNAGMGSVYMHVHLVGWMLVSLVDAAIKLYVMLQVLKRCRSTS